MSLLAFAGLVIGGIAFRRPLLPPQDRRTNADVSPFSRILVVGGGPSLQVATFDWNGKLQITSLPDVGRPVHPAALAKTTSGIVAVLQNVTSAPCLTLFDPLRLGKRDGSRTISLPKGCNNLVADPSRPIMYAFDAQYGIVVVDVSTVVGARIVARIPVKGRGNVAAVALPWPNILVAVRSQAVLDHSSQTLEVYALGAKRESYPARRLSSRWLSGVGTGAFVAGSVRSRLILPEGARGLLSLTVGSDGAVSQSVRTQIGDDIRAIKLDREDRLVCVGPSGVQLVPLDPEGAPMKAEALHPWAKGSVPGFDYGTRADYLADDRTVLILNSGPSFTIEAFRLDDSGAPRKFASANVPLLDAVALNIGPLR